MRNRRSFRGRGRRVVRRSRRFGSRVKKYRASRGGIRM